jgi:hypothetical protein
MSMNSVATLMTSHITINHATPLKALAPIATLLDRDGQLVIAGDPKQLGPVIHHKLADEYGPLLSLAANPP